jgi:tRNA (Thr-GGU) A37 N-methylase
MSATATPAAPVGPGLRPVGVARLEHVAIDGNRLRIGPIEAIDGTPVLDLKPILR